MLIICKVSIRIICHTHTHTQILHQNKVSDVEEEKPNVGVVAGMYTYGCTFIDLWLTFGNLCSCLYVGGVCGDHCSYVQCLLSTSEFSIMCPPLRLSVTKRATVE